MSQLSHEREPEQPGWLASPFTSTPGPVVLDIIRLKNMSLNISLTLEKWLRTGCFGPLAVGDSVDDVIRLLGETEFIGPKSHHSFPSYWLYDEIEFGFDDHATIKWIQSDTVRIADSRTNRTAIDLDWQGVVHKMPLGDCRNWLAAHDLNYRHELDDDGAKITIEDRTQMLLTDRDDPRLVTVWCPADKNIGHPLRI